MELQDRNGKRIFMSVKVSAVKFYDALTTICIVSSLGEATLAMRNIVDIFYICFTYMKIAAFLFKRTFNRKLWLNGMKQR